MLTVLDPMQAHLTDSRRRSSYALSPIMSHQSTLFDSPPMADILQVSNLFHLVTVLDPLTFLASGSDDKYVMIFERQVGDGGAVFGGSEKNVENWKCVATLTGHTAGTTYQAIGIHLPSFHVPRRRHDGLVVARRHAHCFVVHRQRGDRVGARGRSSPPAEAAAGSLWPRERRCV